MDSSGGVQQTLTQMFRPPEAHFDEDGRDHDLSEDKLALFTQRHSQDCDSDNELGDDSSKDLSQKEAGEDDYINSQNNKRKAVRGDEVGIEGSIGCPVDLSLPQGLSVSRTVTNDSVSPARKQKQKQSEDEVTIKFRDIHDGIGRERVFKINEAYYSKKDKEKKSIFVIKDVKMINRKKIAVCDHYRMIEGTFVGNDAGDTLQGKYVLYRYRCNKHLLYLGDRTEKPSIEKSIYYTRKGAKRHGFEIAYTLEKRHLEDQQKIGKPKVLDVFAGVGGMSQAFKKAGFDVKWAVEEDPLIATNFRINHIEDGPVEVYNECVRNLLKNIKENPESPHYKDLKPDIIHFSAPCQGASRANRNGGKNDERNNELTPFCAEYVEHFRPKMVSYENVTGMLDTKNEQYLQRLVAALLKLGYNVRLMIIDSVRYGDPQARLRVFLVAALPHLELPSLPPVTHGPEKGLQPIRPVWKAIADLGRISPVDGVEGRIFYGKGGAKVTYNHSRRGTEQKNEMECLDRNKPARTITRKGNIKHFRELRCLTSRELARLFSFDDSFRFFGSATQQRGMIGNAVPIGVGTAVAKEMLRAYYS